MDGQNLRQRKRHLYSHRRRKNQTQRTLPKYGLGEKTIKQTALLKMQQGENALH
jgi:hypothetical protein